MIQVKVGNSLSNKTVIVPSSKTPRQVFEENGINYAMGQNHLDGSTMSREDLDKTFDQLGVREGCILYNVVKSDNAVTVTSSGNAMVVTSGVTLEQLKQVERFRPDALRVIDGETKDELFVVCTTDTGSGELSSYGACFGTRTDSEGKATITIELPDEAANVREYIADTYGSALLYLKKLEENIDAQLEGINADITAINDAINVQ